MKLQYQLYVLGRKVITRAKNDPDYLKRVSAKDCVVQVRTATGSDGRYFKFNDGNVSVKKGITADAEASLIWKSGAACSHALSSDDPSKKIDDAIKSGALKLEGNSTTAIWFLDIIKNA